MFVERVDADSVSEATQEQNVFGKFLNDSSTEKHADHAQVDMKSLDLSSINNCQKKKKKRARKKRKQSACSISSLGPIEEGALSSALVVHDSSMRDISSNNSVKEGDGSSVLAAGEISEEKASGECPNGEPLSGKKKKKSRRKKKRKLTACPLTSLGSTEEGGSPSVQVVPDISVGEVSLNQLDEVPTTCDSVKLMEVVVVGNGTSVLAGGKISQEISSGECPNGESEFWEKKEIHKMGNLEENNQVHGRIHRRKKRKSSVCSRTSLESCGVQESSAGYTCLNHLDEAPEPSYSGKMMDEVVAGLGISKEKPSGECLDGEPASGNERKKFKMENLEESNTGNSVVMDVSLVGMPQTDFEQCNHDKLDLIRNISSRKKKRKLTACPLTSLGSTEEGASPSVLVEPDSSVGEVSLNQLAEVPATCDSVKLMEVVVVGNGTTVLAGGKISQEISFGERPNGESEFWEKKEIPKMGNLEENSQVHGRIRRRKKRKSSVCSRTSLELCGVQESSAGYTCLNHLDEAPEPSYSGKIMDEVVAGLGISKEKASGECPDGEPASGNERKKFKMENLEESNTGNSVVMDVSLVDMPQTDFEQCSHNKLDVIQNTVLSKENKAAADALGSFPCVNKIEVDNLDIRPMLNDATPSSSNLVGMIDGVSQECPQWSQGGAPLENLRKKLLVLDVNGLLADIVPTVTGRYKPDKVLAQKAVFKRPFCDDFLQFCFDRFRVGVWSSRNRKNVNSVLDFLMGNSRSNLLFCWDQSHCTKTGYNTVENREKPLLLKELKYLWEKNEPDVPWASGEYNESNTLLLDDSPYKALRNPPNTAVFPHSYCYKDRRDNALGPGGDLRVYLEGLVLADNVQKYVEQNPFGQRPITNMNLSWSFYCKIIGNSSSEEGEDATNDPSACQQQEQDATNDSSACQRQEEDATNDSSACQRQEEDATNYSSACQQGS